MERLGRSCHPFGFHIHADEYQTFILQQMILRQLLLKSNSFQDLCVAYKKTVDVGNPLQKQFFLFFQACASFVYDDNVYECMKLLDEAISVTFSDWKDTEWDEVLLCGQEIRILNMYTLLLVETGQYEDAERLLKKLEKAIRVFSSDEELFARVYPQWCYLYIENLIHGKGRAVLTHYIREGLECISQNGILVMAKEFLELGILFGDDKDDFKHKRDALQRAYELAGCVSEEDVFKQFMMMNQHHEIILSNELVRDTRILKKMSQEELSWEICATETLSRIESGIRRPHKRNIEKLYQKLEIDQMGYEVMETDDYELIVMDRDLRRDVGRLDYEQVEVKIAIIRGQLDINRIVNKQYIGRYEIAIAVNRGELDYRTAIERLTQLLQLTCPDYNEGVLRRVPTKNEFQILLHMMMLCKWMGDAFRAKAIGESLLKKFRESDVREENLAHENYLLYINMPGIYVQCDESEKAISLAMEGMRFAIFMKRGDVLGSILAVVSRAYKKDRCKDERFQNLVRDAYWILKLYGFEKTAMHIKEENEFCFI